MSYVPYRKYYILLIDFRGAVKSAVSYMLTDVVSASVFVAVK